MKAICTVSFAALAITIGVSARAAQPGDVASVLQAIALTSQQPAAAAPRATSAADDATRPLTPDAKRRATAALKSGQAALQMGDRVAAIAAYRQAMAANATFAPNEYSPASLALELKRAGVDLSQLTAAPPAAPFASNPAAFAPQGLQRLPSLDRTSSATSGPPPFTPITRPDQVGTAGGVAHPNKNLAASLAAQARMALDRHELGTAQQLAEQAQRLRVPDAAFGPGETRPWEVLLQVESAMSRRTGVQPASFGEVLPAVGAESEGPGRYPVTQGVYQPTGDHSFVMPAQAATPIPDAAAGVPTPAAPAQPPAPSAGLDLYRQGLHALEARDREGALRLFREAWAYQNELDPASRQDLRDKLGLLNAGNRPPAERVPTESTPLEEVSAAQELLRQQLFREISNETREAQKMAPTDPKQARTRLQTLRDRVAASEIDPAARKQLEGIVDRELTALDAYYEQNRGDIELKERNRQILAGIDQSQNEKLEVQQKVAELVEQFNQLIDEERFAEADVIARQVRELDPDNPISRTLLFKSKMYRRLDENRRIAEAKEEGVWSTLTDVDRSSVLDVGDNPIHFNATRWAELSKTRSQWREEQGHRLTPAELEIRQALKQPVEVRFLNRPLREVMDTLSSMTGVNIFLDPRELAAEGQTSDTPISIDLPKPISLESTLNLILAPLGLHYIIQDEVLRISSEHSQDTNVTTRVYYVADLVVPIPNFTNGYHDMGLPAAIREAHRAVGYGAGIQPMGTRPFTLSAVDESPAPITGAVLAQQAGYGSGGTQRPLIAPNARGGAALADFDTLIQLIQSTVAPDTWEEVGGSGAIESFPTNLSLVISQTQEVHEQIADLLEQLRRLQDLQVTIEVRFVSLRDDFFERIGIDFDFDIDDNVNNIPPDDQGPSVSFGLDQDGTPTADFDFSFTQGSYGPTAPQFGGFTAGDAAHFGFAILSDIEAFLLLEAAQGDRRANVLQAPKVTMFNGQLASVNDTSNRPFVTSLIPVVGDFAAAHQPVVTVLSEGTSLSVQAVVSSDRRFVRLTLVPVFSQIGEVEEFTFSGTTTSDTGTNVVDPAGEPTGDVNNEKETREGSTVQLPTFSITSVATTVSVPDGGTVLLGGIKRLREGRNEAGVPMLNKLPYVSRLFKNVGIGRETQSLMLMVTPRIIIQEEEEENLGIELNP